MSWQVERCYQNPDAIFGSMIEAFRSARRSIDFETFIFDRDEVGKKIIDALLEAASRKIAVRLLIDGIGSPDFTPEVIAELRSKGIRIRVYRPWSGFIKRVGRAMVQLRFRDIIKEIVNMNRRDHRKVCVVDSQGAWVGSANISARHADWRETTVYVEGEGVELIEKSFDWVWHRSRPTRHFSYRSFPADSPWVNNSYGWHGKKKDNRFRRLLVEKAERRVRLVNPYFIPPLHFLLPLLRAANDGIQVEIMVPKTSDWKIIEWVSRTYYEILLREGAKIYEYYAGMLHSKILLVDEDAIIGSSNYNFRSFVHDLELDVRVNHPETIQTLDMQWERDREHCEEVSLASVIEKSTFEGIRLWFFSIIKKIM